ncbi:MAG TPA: YihY/virulence factor BrkB family protein [Solirubrobacterales bacterium]|jgi:membrane protein|nr:YihY/virulence factor BrkB family protein [Solirubrobacterales bacterium]
MNGTGSQAPRGEQTAGGEGERREDGVRRDYRPEGAAIDSGMFATLKRTATEFMEDNLTDWAAALTYYGLLALFPALIAMVSLIGLVGDPKSTTSTLTEIITSIGPKSAAQTFSGPIESITSNQSAAGFAFVAGLAVALWSASGYVGAFMRASNIIYETPEGRPFWKLRPLQLAITLAMIVLMAVLALALVLTGPVVDAVAGPIGLGGTAVSVWNIAKWPAMVAIFLLMVAVLYYASPNVKLRGFKWVTPGSLVAIVVWAIASAAFAFYVANFGSYDKTYGTLGGLIALLVWFWISNLAILFGHQLNAERERSLEIEEGRPRAEREIQLEPRSEPKEQKTT